MIGLVVGVALAWAAPEVVVLGIAQDAGHPQADCRKECCRAAFDDPTLRRTVTGRARCAWRGRRQDCSAASRRRARGAADALGCRRHPGLRTPGSPFRRCVVSRSPPLRCGSRLNDAIDARHSLVAGLASSQQPRPLVAAFHSVSP